jgi:hypothetical protein
MKRLTLFFAAIVFISFLPVFLSNAQETITLPDGAKYVGEMKDGKPNGEGTITFPDGSKYVGQVQDGQPNGLGTKTKPDLTQQTGVWKDGKWNAQQTFLQGATFLVVGILLLLFRRQIAYWFGRVKELVVKVITFGRVELNPLHAQMATASVLLFIGIAFVCGSIFLLLFEFGII